MPPAPTTTTVDTPASAAMMVSTSVTPSPSSSAPTETATSSPVPPEPVTLLMVDTAMVASTAMLISVMSTWLMMDMLPRLKTMLPVITDMGVPMDTEDTGK